MTERPPIKFNYVPIYGPPSPRDNAISDLVVYGEATYPGIGRVVALTTEETRQVMAGDRWLPGEADGLIFLPPVGLVRKIPTQ